MVSVYAYKVSCLFPRIRRIVGTGDTGEASSLASTLLAEADDIEAEILTWIRSEPVSSRLHPSDLPMLAIWNMYRSVRSRLQYSLLELLAFLAKLPAPASNQHSIQQRRQNSVLIIRSMAQEIVDSTPYALGGPDTSTLDDKAHTPRPRSWSDALRLLWPLRLMSWSPLILPHQKEIGQAALRRIGWEMGIRQALTSPHRNALRRA